MKLSIISNINQGVLPAIEFVADTEARTLHRVLEGELVDFTGECSIEMHNLGVWEHTYLPTVKKIVPEFFMIPFEYSISQGIGNKKKVLFAKTSEYSTKTIDIGVNRYLEQLLNEIIKISKRLRSEAKSSFEAYNTPVQLPEELEKECAEFVNQLCKFGETRYQAKVLSNHAGNTEEMIKSLHKALESNL